jgi:hypothetical protein
VRDPGQRLGVEQQHAAGEPLAKADVVLVEQPAQDGEALLVLKRWSLREVVGPIDVQRAGDVGALQPGDEQPGASAGARAVGDPGVEQVLAQVAQLELLGVKPAGEPDRLEVADVDRVARVAVGLSSL